MIFMVLLSCESSPGNLGSFDECSRNARWLQTPRPRQPTCINCESAGNTAAIRIRQRHLLLVRPKADARVTVSWRAEGWVDIGIAVKVCSSCQRLYIAVAVVINTKLPASRIEPGSSHTEVRHVTAIYRSSRTASTDFCLHRFFWASRFLILFFPYFSFLGRALG